MGLTEQERRHQAEVSAATVVFGNLFEKTCSGADGVPSVLCFERSDARFRYALFCVSTVIAACARRSSHPDALLNELLHDLVVAVLAGHEVFGVPPGTPQELMNDAATHSQAYLACWSAYVDLAGGPNAAAATALLMATIRSIESSVQADDDDNRRLTPLVQWLEGNLDAMGSAFDRLASPT